MTRDRRIGAARRAIRRQLDAWGAVTTAWAEEGYLDHAVGSEAHLRARRAQEALKRPPMDPRGWGLYPPRGVLP